MMFVGTFSVFLRRTYRCLHNRSRTSWRQDLIEASVRKNIIGARHKKSVRASNEVDWDTAFPKAKLTSRNIAWKMMCTRVAKGAENNDASSWNNYLQWYKQIYDPSSSSAKSSPNGLEISSIPSAGDIRLTWVPLHTTNPKRLVWSVSLNGSLGSVKIWSPWETIITCRSKMVLTNLEWIQCSHPALNYPICRIPWEPHQPLAHPM